MEKSISFSGPMVRAILKGNKTQTRRLVNLDKLRVRLPSAVRSDNCGIAELDRVVTPIVARAATYKARLNRAGAVTLSDDRLGGELGVKPGEFHFACPYADGDTHLGQYATDDKRWTITPRTSRLWVKETWSCDARSIYPCDDVLYKADVSELAGDDPATADHVRDCNGNRGDCYACLRETRRGFRWRSPRFMRRVHSRLLLDVTAVRLERLCDIDFADIRLEGVGCDVHDFASGFCASECTALRRNFMQLWDAINGKRAAWKSNPWVWVVEFKRVRP
jgi:hypothetical protein